MRVPPPTARPAQDLSDRQVAHRMVGVAGQETGAVRVVAGKRLAQAAVARGKDPPQRRLPSLPGDRRMKKSL